MKSLQLTFNCFQFTESFTRKGRKSIALKSKSNSPSVSMCHIILVCQGKQLPGASRRWHRRAILRLDCFCIVIWLIRDPTRKKEDGGRFHHQTIIRETWGKWCFCVLASWNLLVSESSLVWVWQTRFWPPFGAVLVLEIVVTCVTLLQVL